MARLIKMNTTLAGPAGVVLAGECCKADDSIADYLVDSYQAEEIDKNDKTNKYVNVHLREGVKSESAKKPS